MSDILRQEDEEEINSVEINSSDQIDIEQSISNDKSNDNDFDENTDDNLSVDGSDLETNENDVTNEDYLTQNEEDKETAFNPDPSNQ